MIILISFFLFFIFAYAKKLLPSYNFGYNQNYEIDLLHQHLLGHHLYFNDTTDLGETLFIITLYPSSTLLGGFKFYTTHSQIQDALDENKVVYFGIDFNVENPDLTTIQYESDVLACEMSKDDVKCFDYVYDIDNGEYKRNVNGSIVNNNLLPHGFEEPELNILTENVIYYKNYYFVSFEKTYPENYDNSTMWKFINFLAGDMGHEIFGFYGIADSSDDWETFNEDEVIYFSSLLFKDGSGLNEENGGFLKYNYIFILLIFGLIL